MECSENDIHTISGYDFDWRCVGQRLLGDQKIMDIDNEDVSEGEKRRKMLLEWKSTKAHDATYRALVKALNDLGNNSTADRVEELEGKGISKVCFSNPSETIPWEVKRYAEYLMDVYKRTQGKLEGQWPPAVRFQHHTNLLIIEKIEDFTKEKGNYCTLPMTHSKMGINMKKVKEIGQVGLLENGERARCVIVEGIPGVGKSTFSLHLGVCWAQKEILQGCHLVVLLRLRDERVQRAKCVSDLFYHHNQTTQQSVVQWIISLEGDGVMMVLDGYDELSSDLQTSSIFADVITGKVLPKMTVLVSSRPSANQILNPLCQSQKCQYIEVTGFGVEEIQQYVDGALGYDKELRDQLKSYLEHHFYIHGLMYIPINCAIIAEIFRDLMKNKSQLPQTHTEVYQALIKTVLMWHEEKTIQPSSNGDKSTFTISNSSSRFPWLGDVSDETVSKLLVLAKLAYDGTKEDRLIFHGLGGILETLGLLQEVPELYLDSSGSSSYHFIHKTVQEFMAALYVSSLPPDKRAELIMTPNMTMVAPFTAGLTKLQSQDDMESFLTFQREGGDLLVETLHWLFEAHDPDLVLKCMGDGEQEVKLNEAILDPFDCYVLGYCFANSGQPHEFRVFNCTMSGECMKMLAKVENGRAFDYMKVIDFYGNGMGDQGAMEVGKAVRESKVLTKLRLRCCGLSPNGLCEICGAVRVNTTLTRFELTETKFDCQSIASLVTMIRENKVLTSLKLFYCLLSPEYLCELCTAVGMNTTLTVLDLSFNKFADDKSIGSLIHLLSKNQTLIDLKLSGCGLDDDAICSLAKGLEFSRLKTLTLHSNAFTQRGATALYTALKDHPTLTKESVAMPPSVVMVTCRQ